MVVFKTIGNVVRKSILGKLHHSPFTIIIVTVICFPLFIGCDSETLDTQYTLTINIDGNGTSYGGGAYDENTVVSISANPDPGWEFVELTGDIDTLSDRLSSSTTIVMDSSYSLTTGFRLQVIVPTNISNLAFNPP